ncbi:MAG: cation transporter [Magnetospirillum sp.]|nr:cation transporter [Magnetospirillum sp.]
MAGCCADQCDTAFTSRRNILWFAFIVNAAMFLVETAAGSWARSAALQADALDFLGDAANFGISLFVLGLALRVRARAAMIKGACMGTFGSWVVAGTVWHAWTGTLPRAEIMGAVGLLALAANGTVAALLFRHRGRDANMRSIWLCARNDSIANLAVMLAASGVFATGTNWPDIGVAALIAGLNLSGAAGVLVKARGELRQAAAE